MKEALSLATARKMLRLLNGEKVRPDAIPQYVKTDMVDEEIISHRFKGTYMIRNPEGFRTYLAQRYDLNVSLEEWIDIKMRIKEVKRSEQVSVTGNSKLRKTRAFKGFLINSYMPIEATLDEEAVVIQPIKGTSIYLEDFEHFRLAEDVVVVGMENGENFHCIRGQQYLFEGMKVLFVSRYPQSKDLCTWLQMIPNRYIHFGDFDLAGVSIFLTEFYASLGERANFFIPADVEERLKAGNRALYDKQYNRYKHMYVADERLQPLVQMIHEYKRGYEQEGYIKEDE